MRTTHWAATAICIAVLAWTARHAVAAPAEGGATAGHAKAKSEFETNYREASPRAKAIGRAADASLGTAATGDMVVAQSQALAAFQLACAYGRSQDIDAFREADFIRRLVKQLAHVPAASRGDLLAYLRTHALLAHTLAFAVRDGDDVSGIYRLLDRLRRDRPLQLESYPELATALCVVRDHPRRGFNEPNVPATDPVDVFDFYVNNEGRMFYGLHGVPVELLIYIVDNPASLDDMSWALKKYAGTRDVGALFFTVSYDYDFYYGKADQKLHSVPGGYTLPNILEVGGICADQAYFATSVGKSIGIPSAWTEGDSAMSGHAWVGFLKDNGASALWDFDSGRYEDYQVVRGNVTDPQTGELVADSTVGLLSDLIGTNAVMRLNACALIDAAKILAEAQAKKDVPAFPAELLPAAGTGKSPTTPPIPRATSADGELELIEIGLRQFAAYPAGWTAVADLARHGKMSEAQKQRWADLTQRLCGQRHMDFALSILEPMIETVDDSNEQSGLWDIIFKYVQARPDLAADVRLRQARMWEKQKDLLRAGQCYEDVLEHYINNGPFALRALQGAESALRQLGQEQRVLDLYAKAAALVTKPEQLSGRPEYIHESNWYKVREGYADQLDAAGQKQVADQIRMADKQG